ncbi:phage tail protein [Vibrio crassostreae]|uniref:phage tail-collar fiber domain-containing protein n=1 Tax=Vibrio crassostreae TaxID=246167 RepID=UPI00104EF896|nr:phage tail protein [Vibrio crassostreae]TCN02943.1 tail-collar fiber protein [Vibrio crassostreae]
MTQPPENQQQYGSILTVAGENAEQNGKLQNKQITFTHIAIGDANDTYVQPDRMQSALVNELARIPVNSVDVLQPTPDSVPMLKVEAILPDNVNDLVIREFSAVAEFNGNTYFHAVGNCARIYVPPPVNNGNVLTPVTLEMIFVITSADPIVEIDPNVVTASREWVDEQNGAAIEQSKGIKIHPKNASKSVKVGDSISLDVEAVRFDGRVYALVPQTEGVVEQIDIQSRRLYFEGGKISKLHDVISNSGPFQLRSDGTFFYVWNVKDNINVLRFADSSNLSDAHLSGLPFEVRMDGHSFISSAKTRGGQVDQIFRTSAFSDYMYFSGEAPMGNEWFGFSGDTLPAREDGSKKTGEFGSSDKYAFDNALFFPSNRPGNFNDYSSYVQGSQWPFLFEQGVAVKRRSRGQYGYLWRYQGDLNSEIFCVESLNNLLTFLPDGVLIGKTLFKTGSKDYSLEPYINTYHQPMRFDNYDSEVKPGIPLSIKLVKSGITKIARVTLNMFTGSGGDTTTWYWKKEVQINGIGTLTTIDEEKGNIDAGITAVVLDKDSDGDLALSVNYAGGWGGSLRVSVNVEFI